MELELDGALRVDGLGLDEVGDVAFTAEVRLHELTRVTESLEAAYLELTGDSSSTGRTGCDRPRLRSEWTKLWSVRFDAWCTAVYVLVVAALGWLAAAGTQTPPAEPDLAVETALTGFGFGQLVLVVLGVLAVTSEFGTGHGPGDASPPRPAGRVCWWRRPVVVAGWVALVSAVLAVLCAWPRPG